MYYLIYLYFFSFTAIFIDIPTTCEIHTSHEIPTTYKIHHVRYLLHKPDTAAVKPALHVHIPPEQVDCDTHSFVKEQFSPALVSKTEKFIYIYIYVYNETKEKLIRGV